MKAKYWLIFALLGCTFAFQLPLAHSQSVWDKLKQKAKDKANQTNSDDSSSTTNSTTNPSPDPSAAAPASGGAPADIRAYQNYDFTPGETILFTDDFTTTQDGEFPDRWELTKGQGVVNKVGGYQAFLLTDGNYATVNPRMKNKAYLPAQFTLEYDYYQISGAYPLQIFFNNADDTASMYVDRTEAHYEGPGVNLNGAEPQALRDEAFDNRWHHVAIVYRAPQMKIYVDQYRVLTVPDAKFAPQSMQIGGLADQEKPLVFRNVRLASGGGMNMVGKKFTEAKIVTHGINFDVDKATLRPESMGVLNQIKSLMDSDPTLKFQVEGHTDSSGTPAHNLALSQQRADAVRAQLISMGVDGSRLTAKGYGDTVPLAPDDTPEGKENNRRVEFVRIS